MENYWFLGPPDEKEENYEIINSKFLDPLIEIETNIKESYEKDIFYKLKSLLQSAYLDENFSKNRKIKCFPLQNWKIEEISLLHRVSRILDGKNINSTLGSLLLKIMGRKFPPDSFFPYDINIMNEEFPVQDDLYSQIGPHSLSPSLIFDFFLSFVPFPHICWTINSENEIEVDSKSRTTNEQKIRELLKLRSLPQKIYTLDNSFTINTNIKIHKINDKCIWYEISSENFQMSYGTDISNGNSINKYHWINTINNQHPPTVSDIDNQPDVIWLEESNFEDGIAPDIDWCPVFNPNYIDIFINQFQSIYPQEIKYYLIDQNGYLNEYKSSSKDDENMSKIILITADSVTGRLPLKDLDYIRNYKYECVLIECTCNCKCKGKCSYCLLEKGPNKNLSLFYSLEKGWGVMATAEIEAGELISEYTGELKTFDEFGDEKYSYQPHLDDLNQYYISANKKGNIGRYINHSHKSNSPKVGIFTQPNVTAINVLCGIPELLRIGIFSNRKIYPGEEITLNYGDQYKFDKGCYCSTCFRSK